MPRYHNINGNKVQFTAEEETARDAEEKAWADGAVGVVVVVAVGAVAPVIVGAVVAVGVAAATVPLTPGVAISSLVATFCN